MKLFIAFINLATFVKSNIVCNARYVVCVHTTSNNKIIVRKPLCTNKAFIDFDIKFTWELFFTKV